MDIRNSLGLLFLRVLLSSVMILAHGLPKVLNPAPFIDHIKNLGIPLPLVAGYLAIAAETLFPLLIIIGIFTKISAFVAAVNMLFAAFVIHLAIQGDPFSKWELALVYTVGFGTLALTGPGGFSVQRLFSSQPSS